MAKKLNKKPWTSEQKHFIERGRAYTEQLEDLVTKFLGKANLKYNTKDSHFIAGPSGTGKSFIVRHTGEKHKVKLVEITGDTSMSNLAIKLACLAYTSNDEEIYIWLDDCDSIWSDRISLSIMKGATDNDRRVFAWNKNLTSQIQIHENAGTEQSTLIANALKKYQPMGNTGVIIPTDNMHFIVTTNHFLTASNPPPKTIRGRDEAAVRSRFLYTEYKLNKGLSWGWIASIVIDNKILDLTINQKYILLDWMYNNWDNLKGTDMRNVLEIAEDMLNFPDTYPDKWIYHLIDQNQN